jgi:multisubunit Na+/H+ antiporter MnhG subunit
MGLGVMRLDLLETLSADTFLITLGFSFVFLGVIAVAAYGVVRAIEWASRNPSHHIVALRGSTVCKARNERVKYPHC